MSTSSVVALTRDPWLRDAIVAVATAASTTATLVEEVAALHAEWGRAALVLVGADRAPDLAARFPGRRPEVYLLGHDDVGDQLLRWSVPLGAAVLPLPSGVRELTAALVAAQTPPERGVVLGVVGGSGGCGTSTLAAAVATVATRRSVATTLVDLDGCGGGLDLLLGAEREPGWRWSRLAGVRGHLDDLARELVDVDGLGLLAADRGGSGPPELDQLTSVLAACRRQQDLTVIDLPRTGGPGPAEVVRRSDLLVLVVRADLRGLAAAQQVLAALPPARRTGVVVRGRGLDPALVAERLGAVGLGTVLEESAVRRDAERGDPPGRSRRSSLNRVARRTLDLLDLDASHDPRDRTDPPRQRARFEAAGPVR